MVVVTKAPREEHTRHNFEIIQDKIASNVWGGSKRRDRVLFCDSLVGLGAMQLERGFSEYTEDEEITEWKPEYSLTLEARIKDPLSPMHHVSIF